MSHMHTGRMLIINCRSYLSKAASSWIDDYLDWSSIGSCCKYYANNESFCPHNNSMYRHRVNLLCNIDIHIYVYAYIIIFGDMFFKLTFSQFFSYQLSKFNLITINWLMRYNNLIFQAKSLAGCS